jgi:hypothetical protein
MKAELAIVRCTRRACRLPDPAFFVGQGGRPSQMILKQTTLEWIILGYRRLRRAPTRAAQLARGRRVQRQASSFLWVGSRRRARLASAEAGAEELVRVRFLPGFGVELASLEEAERFVEELGEVFARFGVELEASREPPPALEGALRSFGLALARQ